MTPELLIQCMPFAGGHATMFAEPLTNAMAEWSIDNPKRQAAFLAQLAHESGSLKYMEEIADGSAYEGRVDLGNDQPGDGKRYKGHGPIQITGKRNHRRCGIALGIDLIADPLLLTQPVVGSRGAAWFWNDNQLSTLADGDKFTAITHRINGGYDGADERLGHWLRIRKVFGL